MESTEPRRGQIWLVSLGAARSGEPGKNRPAVVISADELSTGSPHDLFVVIPLSTSRARSPLRPVVAAGSGTSRTSVAICTAVRSVSRSGLLRPIGELDSGTLAEIEFALSKVLGLD